MAGLLAPWFFEQIREASGEPLVNGKLYSYVTETVIPKRLFYDNDLLVPCPNPLPLDDSGFVPQFFMEDGSYTFVFKDKNDITISTRDNIVGSLGSDVFNSRLSQYLPLSGGTLSGDLIGQNISATHFFVLSGTSAEFLKADGNISTIKKEDIPTLSYLPLSGGTLSGDVFFDFSEPGSKNFWIHENFIASRKRSGGTYIVNNFDLTNEAYPVQRIQSTNIDSPASLDVERKVSAYNFVVKGATSQSFLKGDGTLDNNNYLTLADVDSMRTGWSSTGASDPVLTEFFDNSDGTGFFFPVSVRLCSAADFTSLIEEYKVPPKTLSFVDGIESYVCVRYNGGSPEYYVETNKNNINSSNIICIWIVWREGLTLHSIGMDSKGLGLPNKISKYVTMTIPYKKSIDGGLVLSESSRNILVTSAVVYAGIVPVNVSAFNSTTDTLTLYYHSAGNWVKTNQTVYDNTLYDNGTTSATLDNNKFGVRWFYRSIGDAKQVFYVLGGSQYNNVAEAKLEMPRNDLPIVLRNHCVLIARIIIQKNASSGLVENISETSFIASSVQNHNDLANIQGGAAGEYYHFTASEHAKLSALSNFPDYLQEPTGFIDRTKSVISMNVSTMTFNISAVSTSYDILYRGTKFTKTSDSITLNYDQGLWYVYFTSAGVLTASKTPWKFSETIPVSLIYQDSLGGVILVGEERHGAVMDWATHEYLHNNFGTRYTSGFTASYTLSNASSAFFGLTDGRISDEDLELTISQGASGNYFTQQINYPGYFPVYCKIGDDSTGATGLWRIISRTNLPYYGWTDQINYNYYVGGTWGQTTAANNNYVAFYIFATNNKNEPIISIQGQRQDISLDAAKNNNTPQSLILTDFPTKEAKLLYRIILKYSTTYTGNPYRVRIEDVTDYRSLDINITNVGGTGTVTYVGLSANPIFTIAGTPITNAGTFTIDLSAQSSGTFLAGPISGTSILPSFRRLTSSDIPPISNFYLPLSGGTLYGQMRGTSISASGNISAADYSTPGSYIFQNSNSMFGSLAGTSADIFIRNLSANGSIIDYPFVIEKTGLNRIRLGMGSIIRPVELGGPVTIQNLSANGFVRSNSSGLLTSTPLVSGDIPSLSYIPLSGGTIPEASSLILSTTAVAGDKKVAVRGDFGFDIGFFTKSGKIFIGPGIETSEPTRIFSPVSAFGSISATSFIKTAYISATGTFSTLSNSNTADNIIIAASSPATTATVNNDFLGRTFNVLCLKNFDFSFNASTSAFYNGNVYSGGGFTVSANNHISLTQIAPNIIICK